MTIVKPMPCPAGPQGACGQHGFRGDVAGERGHGGGRPCPTASSGAVAVHQAPRRAAGENP